MKLYHFTPTLLLNAILKNGLTLGRLPIIDDNGRLRAFMEPCQWLTNNGDWNSQSWATRELIKYDRTAFRLTIIIPKHHKEKLLKAIDYAPYLPKNSQRLITDWPGSEHWYFFVGRIPRGWIRTIEQRPAEVSA